MAKFWLMSSLIGILFGLLPGYVWLGSRVVYTVFYRKKRVATWILRLVNINRPEEIKPGVWFPPYICYVPGLIFCLIWMTAALVFYHWLAWSDYLKGNALEILLIQISFPPFILGTWLLPAYFFERHIQITQPDSKG